MDGYPKTAACACGALTVTVAAPPHSVHACSCQACQRRSGSAFSYTAFFAEADASISAEFRSWRRSSEAGRFHDTGFCPTCGCAMFCRLEAWPGVIGVPAGAFADPAFTRPAKLYWTAHRHEWLTELGDTAIVERQ
jgi:hypothetical protein